MKSGRHTTSNLFIHLHGDSMKFTFLLKLSMKQIISRILFASSDLIIPVSKQENHHLALILWRKILKWWSKLLFSEKDNYTKETKGKQSPSQVKRIPTLRHHSHSSCSPEGLLQTVRETRVARKWNSGISPHYVCPSSQHEKSPSSTSSRLTSDQTVNQSHLKMLSCGVLLTSLLTPKVCCLLHSNQFSQ